MVLEMINQRHSSISCRWKTRACKRVNYFFNTFGISYGRLYRCVSKPEVFAGVDSRGKKTPGNKIDDTEVINHIKSFPAYQSLHQKQKPRKKIFKLRFMYLQNVQYVRAHL